MDLLLYIGFPAAVTVPLTVLLCRQRIRRGKLPSFGSALGGGLTASLITTVCALGVQVFTPHFWFYVWNDSNVSPAVYPTLFGLLFLICLVPALVIVSYYRRDRGPIRNEKPRA